MRGHRLVRPLLLGALALATLAGAGCDRKAVGFNNTLAGYNKRLFYAGRKLGETMVPAVQGAAVNADRVRDAYDELIATLDEIRADFAALSVPPSASGQKFHEGYRKFLQGQSDMLRNDVGRLVRMLQRSSKDRTIGPLIVRTFRQMQKREQADTRELEVLQYEFAREHGLPLIRRS